METFTPTPDGERAPDPSAPPDLITHVAVGAVNTHDGAALLPALTDTQTRGVRPETLLADSHYGSNDNLKQAAEQQVQLISPAMPAKGTNQDKLTLEHFELDDRGLVVRCPQGHSPITGSVGEEKLQVLFDETLCGTCPDRARCPGAASERKEKRYQYTHDRVRQRTRRLQDRTEAFREKYRWRAGIEGTMSRYKHQMGMGRLRIRGQAAVRYAAFLKALGLNIHRVATRRAAG